MELLLACDLVVAASDVRFVFTEIEHGLFASMGGTVRLADHVPRKIAFEWLIAPSEIDMSAALAWGLVNRVVPPGEELRCRAGARGPYRGPASGGGACL